MHLVLSIVYGYLVAGNGVRYGTSLVREMCRVLCRRLVVGGGDFS
jgi:hypothetical protein